MTPNRLKQVEDIYYQARALDQCLRAEFLQQACGADEDMRQQVERLLAEESGSGSFFRITLDAEKKSWVGECVGSYEFKSLVGAGGMGEVYRARDTKLKRDVAIKVLPPEFSSNPERVKRFQREAEILASLNHPNIAAIYDLQESNGTRLLVLELVEGETLKERIDRGPIPVETALEITKQICAALESAHERGIIHRDLKPANVKLTPDGHVKVLDFGLAKAMESASSEPSQSNSPTIMSGTLPGVILGTAPYMSPEQVKGGPTDRTADLWALGCVLYEMLTGYRAFEGETITETFAGILKEEPDWSGLPVTVPLNVVRILRRCLQKDRRSRIHDAADVRIQLEDCELQQVQSAAPVRSAKNRVWVLATLGLLALAVGIFLALRSTPDASANPEARFEISIPT